MVKRIVRQLAQANENLTGSVLKTILTASKVKEQICMHKDPVYTVPDPCGHDIKFGQFTDIFTLTTFSIISFY